LPTKHYAIFDSTGNLIESLRTSGPAREALDRIIDAEPEAAGHVALFVYGDDGMPVGDPVFAPAASGVR
jgi:hypothetical protein